MAVTEIRKTLCSICLQNCGIDAYVSDGRVVGVEGSVGCKNRGLLCCKGYASKSYIYREDRIKTPLQRVGARGEGRFRPISWDEAYGEITRQLGAIKAQDGADSVAFYTGYSKWYRTILHRFAHAFGTQNYGTESSACFQAIRLADMLNAGALSRPDIAGADLFLAWAYNPFYSSVYRHQQIEELREKGLRVICIDPRVTPFAGLSDLHLKIRPGTDGALALFFGNHLIRHGAVDMHFIRHHVHGFEQYSEYVREFTPERTSAITGIPQEKLLAAADMLCEAERFAIHEGAAPISHHRGGVQSHRAIMALSAISGSYDSVGGNLPTEFSNEKYNYPKLIDSTFIDEMRPKNSRPKIGSERFPVWSRFIDEFQAMDLARSILEGAPYPIRGLFTLGLNIRMFPENDRLREALRHVEFFVNTDIFLTEACSYADIVLPACTSFERSQFQSAFIGSHSAAPTVHYVEKVIEPLYQSKSDADILCELAVHLGLNDPVLTRGYDACCKYLLRRVGVTLEDLKDTCAPARIPGAQPYVERENARHGYRTPTGKFELWSTALEEMGYEPLPKYVPPEDDADPAAYPLLLTAGGRLPFEFHSRFQNVRWARWFRPSPAVDLNPGDCEKLGIHRGDTVRVATATGAVTVLANPTHMVRPGSVFLYQDYPGADVNSLVAADHLDPISGFPGYRSVRCRVEKVSGEVTA